LSCAADGVEHGIHPVACKAADTLDEVLTTLIGYLNGMEKGVPGGSKFLVNHSLRPVVQSAVLSSVDSVVQADGKVDPNSRVVLDWYRQPNERLGPLSCDMRIA